MEFPQIILGLAGLYTFAVGLFGWSGPLSGHNAHFIVSAFGIGGARVFYMLLGIGFVLWAIFGDFGVDYVP